MHILSYNKVRYKITKYKKKKGAIVDINRILDIVLVLLITYVVYELIIKKSNKKQSEQERGITVEEEVSLSPEQLKEARKQTLFRLFSSFQVKDLTIAQAQELLIQKVQEKALSRQILIDDQSKDSYEAQIEKLSEKYEQYRENLKSGLKPDIAFEKVMGA